MTPMNIQRDRADITVALPEATPPETAPHDVSQRGRPSYRAVLARYRIWGILLLLMLLATAASGGVFIRPSNVINILFIAAPISIAALGETMVILTAGIDVSVASVWILAAVVGGSLVTAGTPLPLTVAAALAVGLLCGAVNGVLVSVVQLPPLIATLAMLAMAEGAARIYTNNQPVLSMSDAYTALGSAYVGPIPLPVLIWAAVLLALQFVMTRTVLGKEIYAVGGNRETARYSGLRVGRTLFVVYAVAGLLASLGGVLQSAYLNTAVPNGDLNTLFDVIAGAVVGGTSLFGGEGRLLNTMGGVLVIVVIQNLLNILGVSPLVEQAVLGAVIVSAVYLNVGLGGARGGQRVFHKGV
jgi:ribose/xylose/arabinose/galactoside ABC-type transport system permease subunit